LPRQPRRGLWNTTMDLPSSYQTRFDDRVKPD
jgi:hypothetical protein